MKHSKNFEKVKAHYQNKLWNETMVKNSIGKWLTEEEVNEILNIQ